MKHHLPSLDALKVFESAARQLSFSQAAQELCLTRGAISYQIRRLEEELDCALFRRAVRQVYLTDAGQQLLQTVQRLFSDLTQTIAQIKPGDSGNDALIGVTTYVALRWLSPRISAFSELNPEISILLQHSVNDENFKIQDVDFAIRWCQMTGQVTRTRPLELPMPLFPVCSPRLLERRGATPTAGSLEVDDLTRSPLDSTPLLCEERTLDLWSLWYEGRKPPMRNPRRIIADANVRTQAAIDGLGWTMADALMQRELDNGLLVAPFEHRLEGYGYAVQVAPARYVSQNAIALRNWLIDRA
jgi:DNA-binding transcriptional LysR family regulator